MRLSDDMRDVSAVYIVLVTISISSFEMVVSAAACARSTTVPLLDLCTSSENDTSGDTGESGDSGESQSQSQLSLRLWRVTVSLRLGIYKLSSKAMHC